MPDGFFDHLYKIILALEPSSPIVIVESFVWGGRVFKAEDTLR